MSKIKFVLLGTSELIIHISNAIIESGNQVISMISMPQNVSPNNSADISNYAKQSNINYHELEDINSLEAFDIVGQYEPDYIFVSWPKIIKSDLLNIPKYFCIGTHPTNLPFNRGRHPLHWIIVLGISETKLSFFKINKGIDTGEILLQIPIQIGNNDLIIDVNNKVNNAAYDGTKKLCQKFNSNPSSSVKIQNHKLANYWRKRTPHDITLDLRMSADIIIRIVRSFTVPYPCASLIFRNYIIKVEKAKVVKTVLGAEALQRIEPGKIISAKENRLIVKVDDKLIELFCVSDIPHELLLAKYIHPPSKYIKEHEFIIN